MIDPHTYNPRGWWTGKHWKIKEWYCCVFSVLLGNMLACLRFHKHQICYGSLLSSRALGPSQIHGQQGTLSSFLPYYLLSGIECYFSLFNFSWLWVIRSIQHITWVGETLLSPDASTLGGRESCHWTEDLNASAGNCRPVKSYFQHLF